jgi:propanol-preferring alcohol dehydrogenase
MTIPQTMYAMLLETQRHPLVCKEVPVPQSGPEQVLIKVHACGVCRTDLHIADGDLTEPKLPLILGHEVVGTVVKAGPKVTLCSVGDRIGVPWLGHTCGTCRFCRSGKENLCDEPLFTGYTIDGGFAEYTVAHQQYVFKVPDRYGDAEAAPLLCAGLIGYRSYSMIGAGVKNLGIYGFGAAAHIIAQVAVHQGLQVYAFTRPGDTAAQNFAVNLGAVWAGDSAVMPPEKLDAAIIFAPVGPCVIAALKATCKGGIIVCGGIYMSDIPSFPYGLLWEERVIRSVANLERKDGEELMRIAPEVPIKTDVTTFPLSEANRALDDLRNGILTGAVVLVL